MQHGLFMSNLKTSMFRLTLVQVYAAVSYKIQCNLPSNCTDVTLTWLDAWQRFLLSHPSSLFYSSCVLPPLPSVSCIAEQICNLRFCLTNQWNVAAGMSERDAAHKFPWWRGDLLQSSRQNGSLHVKGKLDTIHQLGLADLCCDNPRCSAASPWVSLFIDKTVDYLGCWWAQSLVCPLWGLLLEKGPLQLQPGSFDTKL